MAKQGRRQRDRCGYCGFEGCPECIYYHPASRQRRGETWKPWEFYTRRQNRYDGDVERIPTVYVMMPTVEVGDWRYARKYGATSAPVARLERLNEGSLQQWRYLRMWTMPSMNEAYKAEQRVGRWLRRHGGYPVVRSTDMPHGGASETFHDKHFDFVTFDEELVQANGRWGPGEPGGWRTMSLEEWRKRTGKNGL